MFIRFEMYQEGNQGLFATPGSYVRVNPRMVALTQYIPVRPYAAARWHIVTIEGGTADDAPGVYVPDTEGNRAALVELERLASEAR